MPAKKKKTVVAASRESAAIQPEAKAVESPESRVESRGKQCQAHVLGYHACRCGGSHCGDNVTS